MTRKAGGTADERPEPARAARGARRRWSASSASPGPCTCTEVLGTTLEENLAMIARQRRLPEDAGQARSSTTPSTSSTAIRADPAYALAHDPGGGRGGRRLDRAVRHQRRQPAQHASREVVARGAERGPDPARHPHPQRRRARGRQRAGRASRPAARRCRGRSTAAASAAATPT